MKPVSNLSSEFTVQVFQHLITYYSVVSSLWCDQYLVGSRTRVVVEHYWGMGDVYSSDPSTNRQRIAEPGHVIVKSYVVIKRVSESEGAVFLIHCIRLHTLQESWDGEE